MTADEAAAALGRATLFRDVPPATRQRLGQRTVVRRYARGQAVFVRGDVGDTMFLVLEGLLKVYDTSPDGGELLLTTVGPDSTVGELALADGGPRSASVAAVHPSRLLVLSRADFLHLVSVDGSLAVPLMRYLASQVRRLTDLAGDLVFLELTDRVAKLLDGFARGNGASPVPQGVLLDLTLTQSELAAMVGTSRQSLNTVLNGFAREGLLELRGRQILLLRPDLIAVRAGGEAL